MQKPITLNAGMGEAVLARLCQISGTAQVSAREGIVAGQSVASAVSELFGDSLAVAYNDIDVFSTMQTTDKRHTKGRVLGMTKAMEFELQECYGHLTLNPVYHYQVARTKRDGLLNEILCFGSTPSLLDGRYNILRFLASFDLNCVQVAVDLQTRQLVWTPDFERFCRTRQLLVASTRTPVHTAIRYFRKKQELEGVFGSDEQTLELLGAAIVRDLEPTYAPGGDPTNPHIQAILGRACFGAVYKARYDSVASQLEPWFELVPQEGRAIELFTLKPRFTPDPALCARTVPSNMLPTFARARQGHWRKPICDQILAVLDSPRTNVAHSRLLVHGPEDFLTSINAKQQAQADALFNEHQLGNLHARLSFNDTLALAQSLRKLAREHGTWVYGALERKPSGFANWLLATPEEREQTLQDYVCQEKAVLAAQSVAPVLPKVQLTSGFELHELSRAMQLLDEGARMGHCVGGYFKDVSRGTCRIVSLRKHAAAESLTIELTPHQGGWRCVQARGQHNREPAHNETQAIAQTELLFSVAYLTRKWPGTLQGPLLRALVPPGRPQNLAFFGLKALQHLHSLRRVKGLTGLSTALKLRIDGIVLPRHRAGSTGGGWYDGAYLRPALRTWKGCFQEWRSVYAARLPSMTAQGYPLGRALTAASTGSAASDDFSDSIPF